MGFLLRGSKRIVRIILMRNVLIGLIILGVFLYFVTKDASDTTKIQTAKVSRETVRSEIIATGVVSSPFDISLKFGTSGKVNWVGYKEGDRVEQYSTIATLNNEQLQANLRQAQQDFTAAKAASDQYYDANGHPSVESYDQKVERTALDAAQNKAYDNIRKAQEALQDAVITAPFPGTLVKLSIMPGDRVIANTDIGRLVDLDTLQFKSQVDETDIGAVTQGQKATLSLDAFPDKEFSSTVSNIADESTTTSTGATAFDVTFQLPQTETFRIGMNGEAHIITAQKDNVLTV